MIVTNADPTPTPTDLAVLRLKDDWDIPIQPPTDDLHRTGHFVGRDEELQRLVGELLRSPNKSILISGYRGVGKTSLVYQALRTVREAAIPIAAAARDDTQDRMLQKLRPRAVQTDGGDPPPARWPTRFLIVLQNAAQLEAEQQAPGIEPKQILVNLVRRLYTAAHSMGLQPAIWSQIEALYNKATASEVKFTRFAERKLEVIAETEERRELSLDITRLSLRDLVGAGLALVVLTELVWAPSSLPLRLAPLAVIAGAVTLSYVYIRRSSRSERREDRSLASELYAFDNSISNLEFDLEAIHRDLQREGIRAIYVIDELDKLPADDVAEVLKFFKNLFTLSSAIFIFVGGEELYQRFREAESPEQGVYRSKEYTYFTSKYFLARPTWRDIDAFVADISVNDEELDPDQRESMEVFKRVVAFDARGDYFDLLQRIKDRVSELEDVSWGVELAVPTADERLRATLQGALTIVFDDSYRVVTPSRWDENEALLRRLYEFTHALVSLAPGSELQDDPSDSPEAGAVRDLSGFLNRLGMLNVLSETTQEIRGLNVPVRTYQYTARAPTALPSSLGAHSEFEDRFVQEFRRFWEWTLYLANVWRLLRDQPVLDEATSEGHEQEIVDDLAHGNLDPVATSTFTQYWPLFQRLTTTPPPYPESREHFESAYDSLRTATGTVRSNAPLAFANFLRGSLPDVEIRVETLISDPSLFSEDTADQQEAFTKVVHGLVVAPQLGKNLLVIGNPDSELLTLINRATRRSPRTHRSLIVKEAGQGSTKVRRSHEIQLDDRDPVSCAKELERAKGWLVDVAGPA